MDRVGIRALVAAATCLPSASWALGLGNIEVNSRLNQRLDAQIELVGATAADLEQLTATLASREVFASQGVDYPSAFATIDISARRDASGRAVLHLTSRQSIVEPIATLVVQADWSRGRMQRAYTILLDPPGLGGERAPAPPLTAAVTPSAVVAAPQRDPQLVSSPAPVARTSREPVAAAQPRTPIEPGMEYGPVVRGESLWKIAVRVRDSGVSLERTMEAIYQANPQAFAGSMDRLEAGAVLSIPAAVAIGDAEALAASPTAPAPSVAPAVSAAEQSALFEAAQSQLASSAPPPAAAADQELLSAVRRQIASTRASNAELNEELEALNSRFDSTAQLLAAREAELDRLRAELSNLQDGAVVDPQPQLTAGVPSLVDTAQAASAETAPVGDTAQAQRSGLVGSIAGAVLWFTLGALAVGLTRLRRRAAPGTAQASEGRVQPRPLHEELTAPPAAAIPPAPDTADDAVPFAAELPPPPPRTNIPYAAQATPSELRSDEEDGPVDAVAEADILLAYGHHGQASELVQAALLREPRSLALKAKLLEVYFAANKPDAFAEAARAYQASLREHATFWRGALAMGRQLCPDEALFASATGGSPAPAAAQAADPLVDFDLGEPDELPFTDDFPTVRAKIVSDEEAAAAQAAAASQGAGEEELTARVEGPEFTLDGVDTLPEEEIDDPTVRSRTLAMDTAHLAAEMAQAQDTDSIDAAIAATDILHGVDDPLRGVPAGQAFEDAAEKETARATTAAGSTDATTLRITMDMLGRGAVEEAFDASSRSDRSVASDDDAHDARPKRASSE
ncbi:MAG: FimV/HubP family polar landmark protein [Pseudomonadota bacterium]